MDDKGKSVSLKELREKFYELRDLEIQNLWQRASIFAGLIGLFFAGYGYILIGFLLEGEGEIKEVELAHVLCCGIAILAIIFSVIWIAMAKGAKAWFEVQERKICEIEEEEELAIPRRFRMGALSYPGIDSEPNDCLLSGEGGRYSVSKLNILLGQVLFICWCGIFLLHAFFLIFKEWDSFNLTSFFLCLSIVLWVGFFVLLVCRILKEAKSRALLTTEGYLKKRLELFKEEVTRSLSNASAMKSELNNLDQALERYLGCGDPKKTDKSQDPKASEASKKQYETIMEFEKTIKEKLENEELVYTSYYEGVKRKRQLNVEVSAFFREIKEIINRIKP